MTDAAANRRAAAWIAARSPTWRRLEPRLRELEDGRSTDAETAFDAVRSYPELARDLAIARRENPASALTRQLEQAYARLHRGLFRSAANPRHDFVRLCRIEVPLIAGELRQRILVVAIGFLLAAFGGWWLVMTFPELAGLVASEKMIERLQQGQLWTDDLLNIMPSSMLSARIFANNIAVALAAFALGSIYGLGTLYIIVLNGILIGAAFALAASHGLHGRLFEFVAAHGFVELTVIFIAGAIGFSIGEAIARPAHRTRIAAFQRAVSRGIKLMLPCMAFLVGAGLIEGYVSPNPAFPLAVRIAIGIGFWFLLLWTLSGFRLPFKR